MIRERITVKKIEFYITNVCNLTCEDCNRFNNHNFKGWQDWKQYQSVYQRWAEYIDIQQIVVLGGEPLLNPTVMDWIHGLSDIWKRNVQILTNGTRINHVSGLYQVLLETNNWLGISLHDQNYLPELEQEIRKFMTGRVRIVDKTFRGKKYDSDIEFWDSNLVCIPVWLQDEFMSSAVKLLPNGKFGLHASDPEKAHAICPIAQNKSYHFIRGKLYKCGPVALFPEFDQQHGFAITDAERHVMNAYEPLSVAEFEDRGRDFLDSIDDAIPQCRFCPEQENFKKIIAIRKGG